MWTLHKLERKQKLIQTQDVLSGTTQSPAPWHTFSPEDLDRFPALKGRNFWCIQRHQATALHYDLRMQVDGGTVSWAIPKGPLGLSKPDDPRHLAVETTVHPISYTLHEGSDGRVFRSGARGGTLLWDVGTYTIDDPSGDPDSESVRRGKRRRVESAESDGSFEESKFRDALRRIAAGDKPRSFHFTLRGGKKLKNNSYILVFFSEQAKPKVGGTKKEWLLSLPRDVDAYSWGDGGEDGEEYGRSVKTGRTFKEVCSSRPEQAVLWQTELSMFAGWTGDQEAYRQN